jgi:LemA protein
MNTFAKVLMIFVLVIAMGCAFSGCMLYGGYNKAISLDEQVKASWAQVENQLQRRFDLVPNLVETVKGVAAQEKEVFTNIANARTAYGSARTTGEKVEAANRFESALSRLLVIQERYPELRSSEAFNKLMDSIEGTENRLSVERMRYNESVRSLNTYTRQLFGRIVSGWADVKPAEFFEIEEAAAKRPDVNFTGDKAP